VDQEFPFLFLRDFNFPGVDWDRLRVTPPISKSTSRFIDFCLDSVIYQHVHEPIRFRGNQTFVLDLIFTRFPHKVRDMTVGAPLGKGGHAVLHFKYGRERAPTPFPSFRHQGNQLQTDGACTVYELDRGRTDPNNVEDLLGGYMFKYPRAWGTICPTCKRLYQASLVQTQNRKSNAG